MSNLNPKTKNQPDNQRYLQREDNPKPRKPRPGYKRIVVGYRLVAMQASHVDAIARLEVYRGYEGVLGHLPRCPKCFLKGAKSGHFCRWNVAREAPGRDPNPQMRQEPIFQWVKDSS